MIVQVNQIDTDTDGLMGCPDCTTSDEYREAMRSAYKGKWGQCMISATCQERVTINGCWANEAAEILKALGMPGGRTEIIDSPPDGRQDSGN